MIMRHALLLLCLSTVTLLARAEDPAPPKEPPANETLEPAVDTSAPAASDATAQPAATQPKESEAVKGAATPAAGETGKAAAPAPRARSGKAMDRLELDTTQITGNRELPKVLYIVPWKRADLGDLLGKPVNSLLDEVLAPVDRDVFKRENRYYRALQPDAAAVPPTPAQQPPPGTPE